MTVVVGKKTINLGWETFGNILLLAITVTWGVSNYKNSQQADIDKFKTDTKLDKILAWQNQHGVKDSLTAIKLDSVFIWHARNTIERSNMKADVKYLMHKQGIIRTAEGYYTERWVNGKLILDPSKPTRTNN